MKKVLVLLAIVGALAAVLFACSQAPTPVPVRTFERAQRVDAVCLRLYADDGKTIVPEPQPQEACAPVPANVDGETLQNQLFAVVTQSARGEVAVVDLSAGKLVDQRRAVPGINFVPVGSVPTDVAATPDGRMVFVASAQPNKAAIYGIPSRRLLGDTLGFPADPDGPATVASWPVCALPQNPGAIAIVPRRATATAADAGAGDASADAGAGDAADVPPYEIVAVLPGDRRSTAKLVTIDPRPFLRGAARRLAGNVPDLTEFPGLGPGPLLERGSLAPCPITSAIELTGSAGVPSAFTPGRAWDTGIVYVDGGVDLSCQLPSAAGSCGPKPCCAAPDGGAADGGDGGGATAACTPPGQVDAGSIDMNLGPLDPPRLVSIARDDQTVYVADEGVPLIHVVDLSTFRAPKERPPLLAASVLEPSRTVAVRDLAVSPPTRDYKRFLYAVDRKDGSIMVYDVTDPSSSVRTPLTRPNPELNPFQPPDRISFGSPVVAVSFARHDFPLSTVRGVHRANAESGTRCNPNPNIDANPEAIDFGYFFRANSTDPKVGLGPARLRGIFAFATLANGQIVAIDVDDWDAPCRRPRDLSGANGILGSSLALPQQSAGPADYDPWHVPVAPDQATTDEAFFPVSTPHRVRSAQFLRDDALTGKHIPYLAGVPNVDQLGSPLPLTGQGSDATPRIRPTAASGTTPEELGVTFSFEVPDVHLDQDWAVTYEGSLPGFDGIRATIGSDDGYQSAVFAQPSGRFCARGIEDWTAGIDRAGAVASELTARGVPVPARLDRRMLDYVQLIEDILPPEDPYWSLPDDPGQCWDPRLATGAQRYAACATTYGGGGDGAISPERDFPILEAYDDRLVVGRFYTPANGEREVVYKDATNTAFLKLMRCCFHGQAKFRVRAGAQWIATGSNFGFMSHVNVGKDQRCTASCDARDALRNGRAPALPSATPVPTRDSALAMRNPAFSFFVTSGTTNGKDVTPARDTRWRFSTRGQFRPVVINLASSTTSVNPQSMRFIDSLGQIAVVDAATQGLVLIDLDSVTIARAPYF